MSESTEAILRRAHELIENNQLDQAQELLAPLLETENDNPAFWWVYSHAVTESGMGIAALDRVLQLDQTYPGARELKADVLAAEALVSDDIETGLEAAAAQPAFTDTSAIDDWETVKPVVEEAATNPRTGRGFVLLVVALLIAASGALLVLSGAVDLSEIVSMFSEPTDEPIIVVVEPTAEPTATVALEPTATAIEETATEIPVQTEAAIETEMVGTEEPTAEATAEPAIATTQMVETADDEAPPPEVAQFVTLVAAQITDFTIDESQGTSRETELGITIDILICAAPGPEFNERLQAVMNAAVTVNADIPQDIEAFAVSLVNCADENASVRTIGVARSVLDEFAADEIDAKTFQRSWQPLS